MKNTHEAVLKKLYSDFTQGKYTEVLSACSDSVTFQIAGKSAIAGKYTRDTFISGLMMKMKEISSGTYQLEVHDIMASDQHATVLTTAKFTSHGKTHEIRSVHVWRFNEGKPLAWYEYPRDMYAYDAAWML